MDWSPTLLENDASGFYFNTVPTPAAPLPPPSLKRKFCGGNSDLPPTKKAAPAPLPPPSLKRKRCGGDSYLPPTKKAAPVLLDSVPFPPPELAVPMDWSPITPAAALLRLACARTKKKGEEVTTIYLGFVFLNC